MELVQNIFEEAEPSLFFAHYISMSFGIDLLPAFSDIYIIV